MTIADPASFIRANTEIAPPPLVPEIRLHLASEVTPLWHATEATLEQDGLPPPYWAFAWPGGQALARYLLDRPEEVRGKRVWDIGAGGGLTAIAALRAGAASAIAFEIDPFARAAIALNGRLNGVAPEIGPGDVLATPYRGGADLMLIGDMCYERPLAERLLAWLDAASLTFADLAVLLADPGRAYLPKAGLEFVTQYDVPTSLDLEDRTIRTPAIYRLAVA